MGLFVRRRQSGRRQRHEAICSAARAPTSRRWPISACRCRPASPSPPRSAPISTPTDKPIPPIWRPQVEAALAHVGAAHRPQLSATPTIPLLVSVRSGARASMPGMMDTVLNLGLNDETVEALAKRPATSASPSTATAASSRCIPTWCWASTTTISRRSSTIYKELKGYHARHRSRRPPTGATIVASYKDVVEREIGKPFPQDAAGAALGRDRRRVRLLDEPARRSPIAACTTFPASWGTAVNVQSMVFGNMGETSATGVAFTRNPSTGENELYGEFLINAQGEDVVAGIRTPQIITEAARIAADSDKPSMEEALPEVFAEFVRVTQLLGTALPRHAGHRVHRRARQALDAADAQRQAHRARPRCTSRSTWPTKA